MTMKALFEVKKPNLMKTSTTTTRFISKFYLRVPYFWYVRTKTRVKIMCDENIKSPHPYNTPRGTAYIKIKISARTTTRHQSKLKLQ